MKGELGIEDDIPDYESAFRAAVARISALEEALRECSEDLAVEIANYYKDTLDYPSQKRKYDRDMEPVLKARALLKGKEKE